MKTRYRNTMYKYKLFKLSLLNLYSSFHKHRPQDENKAVTCCKYLFSRHPLTFKYIIKYTYFDTYIIFVYLIKPGEIVCRNKEVVSVQRRHFTKTYTISKNESDETCFKAINLVSGHLFS
jgi:hypothetical protein